MSEQETTSSSEDRPLLVSGEGESRDEMAKNDDGDGDTLMAEEREMEEEEEKTPMLASASAPSNNKEAESVASECSGSHHHHHRNHNQIPSAAEPLSARQQVALWLTRTSMTTDVSGMNSLKNLLQPSKPASSSPHARSEENRQTRQTSDGLQRHYSTNCLYSKDAAAGGASADSSPSPMRKCETVVELQAMSVDRSAAAKSTLSLFRRLASAGTDSTAKAIPVEGNSRATPGPSFSVTSDVFTGRESEFRGIRPVNRHRSTHSVMLCSRCTSSQASRMTSRTTSQMSLLHTSTFSAGRKVSTATNSAPQDETEMACKICLTDMPLKEMVKLQACGCLFCKECLHQYISVEVMEGSYEISCPDSQCDKQGNMLLDEMEVIVGKELIEKHKTFRLNTEVALDKNRAWCPGANCNTICHVCEPPDRNNSSGNGGVSVQCPSCSKEFCSHCSANWHPGRSCAQNGRDLVHRSRENGISAAGESSRADQEYLNLHTFGGNIKPCPMCRVPIERDAGCAQMMCKRCKHVFCWLCLTSLDDDFLLRHYDSGACKGRLGHSRVSVLWHRAQVIGIFAGFAVLLLVASPILLLAAPCILCCRCKLLGKLDSESSTRVNNSEEAAANTFEMTSPR